MSDATLLIVDDEPANLAVLSRLLQTNYRVRAVNSGRRCLNAATQQPIPDLILLDVMMPVMDGYAVLARLQKNPATRPIPVIFVTALGDDLNEEKGLALGAADYLTKPIRPAILLARVRTHLELKAARDRLQRQNECLEQEVARRTEDILIIQDIGMHALAQLAETRDNETGNHIRRTQAYVGALAQRLRRHPRWQATLTDHFIHMLTQSAPLHDIGKVGIPDSILLKPGRLTPDEMAVMRTHAKLGADAIEKAMGHTGREDGFLSVAKEIAHWHHEKWDGGGYPDGLRGEAIPLSARMMALAYVFDALVSVRVYKPAMPFEQACSIIEEERGHHFDPELADAFTACREEFIGIAEQHVDPDPTPEREHHVPVSA